MRILLTIIGICVLTGVAAAGDPMEQEVREALPKMRDNLNRQISETGKQLHSEVVPENWTGC